MKYVADNWQVCGSEQVTVRSQQNIFSYISCHWIKYLRYCGMLRRNNHNYNHRRFKNNKIVICKSICSKNVAHCSHIFNKLIFLHIQRRKHTKHNGSVTALLFNGWNSGKRFFLRKHAH